MFGCQFDEMKMNIILQNSCAQLGQIIRVNSAISVSSKPMNGKIRYSAAYIMYNVTPISVIRLDAAISSPLKKPCQTRTSIIRQVAGVMST